MNNDKDSAPIAIQIEMQAAPRLERGLHLMLNAEIAFCQDEALKCRRSGSLATAFAGTCIEVAARQGRAPIGNQILGVRQEIRPFIAHDQT